MKCYLHIGTEKTGTTTLQEFFYRNRKELIGKGYYYPESPGLPNNRFLSLLGFNAQRRDDFTRLLGIKTDEELALSDTEVNQMADLIADLWLRGHQVVTDEWYRFGRMSIRQKLLFIFKRILKKVTVE